MKLFTTFLAFTVSIALCSCTEKSVDGDEGTCLRAKYVMAYCSSGKPLHVIQFFEPTGFADPVTVQSPDSTLYMSAVMDLPESVQKKDAVFFMKFHYDKKAEDDNRAEYCVTIHNKLKILTCDGISGESCQSSLTKQ